MGNNNNNGEMAEAITLDSIRKKLEALRESIKLVNCLKPHGLLDEDDKNIREKLSEIANIIATRESASIEDVAKGLADPDKGKMIRPKTFRNFVDCEKKVCVSTAVSLFHAFGKYVELKKLIPKKKPAPRLSKGEK